MAVGGRVFPNRNGAIVSLPSSRPATGPCHHRGPAGSRRHGPATLPLPGPTPCHGTTGPLVMARRSPGHLIHRDGDRQEFRVALSPAGHGKPPGPRQGRGSAHPACNAGGIPRSGPCAADSGPGAVPQAAGRGDTRRLTNRGGVRISRPSRRVAFTGAPVGVLARERDTTVAVHKVFGE